MASFEVPDEARYSSGENTITTAIMYDGDGRIVRDR